MIEIKFTGNNFEELRNDIQAFAVAHLHGKFALAGQNLQIANGVVEAAPTPTPAAADVPVAPSAPAPQAPVEAAAKPKKSGGRPKKTAEEHLAAPKAEAAPVEAVSPIKATEAVKLVPEPGPTMDEVTKALQKVWDKYGMDKSMACLQRFGVKRAREILPEAYPDFIAHCEEVAG